MGYVHPLPSVLLWTWEKEVVLLKQLDVCARFLHCGYVLLLLMLAM
jgi:hypothetical protein